MKVYVPLVRRPRIEMVPLIDTFFLLLAFFISSVLTLEMVRGLPVEIHPRSPSWREGRFTCGGPGFVPIGLRMGARLKPGTPMAGVPPAQTGRVR